jgi:hypothetical protein
MKMRKLALFLAAFVFSAVVAAQTAPTATLSWNAVTTYTDGTTIPSSAPVTYNIYQGTSATTLVKVATGVTALTSSISTGLSDGNTYFWAVTAVSGGVEGAQSNVASKAFAAGTPGAVTLTVK